MKNNNLIIDVEESPKKWYQWLLFAMQHVLAVLVATITVPLIIPGLPIAATMMSAGLGTLFYIFATKKKSPVFLSSSFAYIAPMSSALAVGGITNAMGQNANYAALMIGMAMVGIIYCIIGLVIKFVGTDWLNKLLPPIVVGPTIMIIGLSLAVSAVGNLTNTAGGENGYNLIFILCGLVALFATAFASHYGEGKMIGLIPFIIGMGSGYLMAILFTCFGYYLGGNEYFKVIDFQPLIDIFTGDDILACIFNYKIFVPNDPESFMFLRWEQLKQFDWASIGQIALLFIPVSLVTICEHTGDHKNLGNIIGRDLLVDEPGFTRTLVGSGVSTGLAGQLSGTACTTYGESVAIIGTTKVASVNVIITAAIMMVVFSLLTPFTGILRTIPSCVTGGVSLILYGYIAISGVKMLFNEKIDFNKNKNIFILSAILVAGIGGLSIRFAPNWTDTSMFVPYSESMIKSLIDSNTAYTIVTNVEGAKFISYVGKNITSYAATISPVAVAMILGIILNAVLRDKKQEKEVIKTE